MLLTTPTGASVPLEDLAEIYYEDSPQQIVRKDKVYQVNITMQPNIGFEDTAQAAVNELPDVPRFSICAASVGINNAPITSRISRITVITNSFQWGFKNRKISFIFVYPFLQKII